MAETYYQQTNVPTYPSTVSVVDMSYVENVAAKTSALAAVIRQHWITTAVGVWGIVDGTVLQRFEENGDWEITNRDRLADLYHFAKLVGVVPETEVQNAADQLLSALHDYIVYNRHWDGTLEHEGETHTWDHGDANGVTVALPRSPISFYTSDWLDFAGGVDSAWEGTGVSGL